MRGQLAWLASEASFAATVIVSGALLFFDKPYWWAFLGLAVLVCPLKAKP